MSSTNRSRSRTRNNPLAKLLSTHHKAVSTSTSTVCRNGLCEETSVKQFIDKSGKPVTSKTTRQFEQKLQKVPSLFDSFIPRQLLSDFEFPRSRTRRQHKCNCPYCIM